MLTFYAMRFLKNGRTMKKSWLIILILCVFCVGYAGEKKTICLNMIVKDESKVIKRSLQSVKPLIDYWVIVDTGSTDGTQKIIREFMKDIPGELHERPWVDFARNRNEALSLAKGRGDYVLFIDADEEFTYAEDFTRPKLELDSYLVEVEHSGSRYYRKQLINNRFNWKWYGVVHEFIGSTQATTEGKLEGVTNVYRSEGCRSQDPNKYLNDAKVLEKALQKEPNNSRYVFYLAQSYKDAGDLKSALKNYEKRVDMGGWDEEIFWSLYQVGHLQEQLDYPMDVVVTSYCDAYHFRPTRAEPLGRLASYYRTKGAYLMGYLVADMGSKIPRPSDILMVEEWMYDYWITMERTIGTYWVGKYKEALWESVKLLADKKLPEGLKPYVEDVVKWSQLALAKEEKVIQ